MSETDRDRLSGDTPMASHLSAQGEVRPAAQVAVVAALEVGCNAL